MTDAFVANVCDDVPHFHRTKRRMHSGTTDWPFLVANKENCHKVLMLVTPNTYPIPSGGLEDDI